MEDQTHPKAQQDNTFVRNEGFGPIRDIVKRNQEHYDRLRIGATVKADKEAADRRAERDNYEPVSTSYEPIPDTRQALNKMATQNVFTRGNFRKDIDARPPYKRQ